jgi:hypothetical protein
MGSGSRTCTRAWSPVGRAAGGVKSVASSHGSEVCTPCSQDLVKKRWQFLLIEGRETTEHDVKDNPGRLHIAGRTRVVALVMKHLLQDRRGTTKALPLLHHSTINPDVRKYVPAQMYILIQGHGQAPQERRSPGSATRRHTQLLTRPSRVRGDRVMFYTILVHASGGHVACSASRRGASTHHSSGRLSGVAVQWVSATPLRLWGATASRGHAPATPYKALYCKTT